VALRYCWRDNLPDYIETLRRRLAELGCPIARMRRLVREAADHREDLKQAALAEGLAEVAAEVRADVQLGEPLALAENLMTTVRRSAWWGRHCIIGFGVLPWLAFPVLWLLLLVFELLLVVTPGCGWDAKKLHAAANDPASFHYFVMVFQFMDYIALALATLLFCWLARRAAVGLKWMVTACAICSLLTLITWGKIEPHSFFVGFTVNSHLHLQWIRGAIPLAVAGAVYVIERRTRQRFLEKIAV